ncbi:hypothetical protein QJU96_09520 [Pasteurella skyensis]|uniref:Uncharacterized protein n=1 Tax=Phocoenobacter skyensis TaxID=97481 RepID=A0AAJ6NES3_9PAST|nr:hypothetical protein [Pasteurella skyensis]MDP8171518.1 hypothetical protein [Pasteurella skyensis]MDP8175420.1 hypothetical protein [Pasteurella skyensis]
MNIEKYDEAVKVLIAATEGSMNEVLQGKMTAEEFVGVVTLKEVLKTLKEEHPKAMKILKGENNE